MADVLLGWPKQVLMGQGLSVCRPLGCEDAQEWFGLIARCTVKRLKREAGEPDMRHGPKRVPNTVADRTADRPVDLVGRDFTASALGGGHTRSC